jgi:hypothetical protein
MIRRTEDRGQRTESVWRVVMDYRQLGIEKLKKNIMVMQKEFYAERQDR